MTLPLRRSRGYAPLPVSVPDAGGPVILATGGDLKTTFCLMASDGQAHMSSHLGDMADPRTQACFAAGSITWPHDRSTTGADRLRHAPGICDHPLGAASGPADGAVQHHHAHAVSLLAEHGRLGSPMLAVTYDGTGYGTDGTIWAVSFSLVERLGSPASGISCRSPYREARCSATTRAHRAGPPVEGGDRLGHGPGPRRSRRGRGPNVCPNRFRAASVASRPPAWGDCSMRCQALGGVPGGHLRGPGRDRVGTSGASGQAWSDAPRLRRA